MKKVMIFTGLFILACTVFNAIADDWGWAHIIAFAEGGLVTAWGITAKDYLTGR